MGFTGTRISPPPESDTVINGVCGLIEGQLRQQTGPPGMILMDVTLARSA